MYVFSKNIYRVSSGSSTLETSQQQDFEALSCQRQEDKLDAICFMYINLIPPIPSTMQPPPHLLRSTVFDNSKNIKRRKVVFALFTFRGSKIVLCYSSYKLKTLKHMVSLLIMLSFYTKTVQGGKYPFRLSQPSLFQLSKNDLTSLTKGVD